MRKELLNYTQNRELSWLRFNERVLQEAQDPTVPLLERMKFVAIDVYKRQDMTEGTPWKKIVLFTIPMLIGNIAQQLYNTVDSIIVGRYVGDNALAAVGSASPILNLLIVLFIGISVGVSIMAVSYTHLWKAGKNCKGDPFCCKGSSCEGR